MGEFYRPWVKTQRLDLAGPAAFVLGSADTFVITKSSSVDDAMVRSLLVTQTMTAAIGNDGQVEVVKAQLNSEVNSGGWAVALSGVINFGTAGHPNGVAAAVSGEMIPPNMSLTRGSLYAMEAVFGCQTNSEWGNAGPVAFQKYENYGTKGYFSTNAFLFHLIGETGGAGELLSADDQTLKVRIGTSTKYLVLSGTENCLALSGSPAAAIAITGTPTHSIKVGASGAGIVFGEEEGGINVAIYSNYTGLTGFFRGLYVESVYTPDTPATGEASVYGIRGKTEMASGCKNIESSSERMIGVDGCFENKGELDGAGLWVAGIRGAIFGGGTYTEVKILTGVLSACQMTPVLTTGIYSGFAAYSTSTVPDCVLAVYRYWTLFLDLTDAVEGAAYLYDKIAAPSGDIIGNLRMKDTDGNLGYINVYSDQGDA